MANDVALKHQTTPSRFRATHISRVEVRAATNLTQEGVAKALQP